MFLELIILNYYRLSLNLIDMSIFVSTEGYEFEYAEAHYPLTYGLKRDYK